MVAYGTAGSGTEKSVVPGQMAADATDGGPFQAAFGIADARKQRHGGGSDAESDFDVHGLNEVDGLRRAVDQTQALQEIGD